MTYFAQFDRDRTTVPVPENIVFGDRCLTVPDLRDARVPEGLAKLPLLKPLVGIGDWVKRDQPILSAHLPVFDGAAPPSRWTPWLDDRFTYLEYTLTSPISGLVVDMQRSRGAYHGMAAATNSGLSICYGDNAVLPTLLVPADEPPAPIWSASYFERLGRSLQLNFERLLYSHRDGYARLGSILDQFEQPNRAEIEAFRSMNTTFDALPTSFMDVTRSPGAVAMIVELRAHVPSLRTRLRHIGGVAC